MKRAAFGAAALVVTLPSCCAPGAGERPPPFDMSSNYDSGVYDGGTDSGIAHYFDGELPPDTSPRSRDAGSMDASPMDAAPSSDAASDAAGDATATGDAGDAGDADATHGDAA